MRIGSVDIPDGLILAHTEGTLAMFVGAGASIAPPSNLPSFGALARMIAEEAGHSIREEDAAALDTLLGNLDDGDTDVHLRTHSILSAPDSLPNDLHRAIVSLAEASAKIRIVTTNYDRHLSTVLSANRTVVEEYRAPALPVGNDFDGVAYIHGTLTQEPRKLIVTDRDFGQAYLTDAWASRFLERMFHSYTALFIGYSHDDVVMRYLARGLGPHTKRFALTPRGNLADWTRLGVTPVFFDVVAGSFDQLHETIQLWAERSSMDLLAHRQRIAVHVQAPPSDVPDHASYLESVLASPDTTQQFCELATRKEWLTWANTQPAFRRLFDPAADDDPLSRHLAYWYADRYVTVEAHTEHAFEILAEHRGHLSPRCAATILHVFHIKHVEGQPRPAWLDRWVPCLLRAGEAVRDFWDFALLASVLPDNREAALLMFDFLTEPYLGFDRGLGTRGQVQVRGSTHFLPDGWKNVLLPHLGDVADDVLAIAERHIRRARRLHLHSGPSATGWDPWTIHRSSIAHTPDHMHDAFGVLIDAARDALAHMMEHDSVAGLARCNSWASSGVPLLERLAIHTIINSALIDTNTKLDLMCQRPHWLFDATLRFEVAGLVETASAGADAATIDTLIAHMRAGAPDLDAETLARFQLPILGAIRRGNPQHQATNDAIDELADRHPDLAAIANEPVGPAFVVTAGFVADEPPMTADEFHQTLAADTTAALSAVYEFRDAHSPWRGPSWSGTMQLITAVVGEHPTDGLRLLDEDSERNQDITAAVIRGWAKAQLDDPTTNQILGRLRGLDLAVYADDISRLLEEGGSTDQSPTQWSKYDEARALATETWRALPNDGDYDSSDDAEFDWLARAANRSSGRLARFWLDVVAYEWNRAEDGWAGLLPATRDVLSDMVTASSFNHMCAEVVLASQLHFLHAADPTWCESTLLPHFLWIEPDRSARDWHGYLYWGRFNDRLLNAGLLAGYIEAAANAERFTDELLRQLGDHLAAIAVFSEIHPASWLAEFTRRVAPAVRAQWIQYVGWLLERLEADAVEAQWARWMGDYWSRRVANVPNVLTPEEASALATWTLDLSDDSFADGVALATRRPVDLPEHSRFFQRLADKPRPGAAAGDLVAHVLRGTNGPFWECHELQRVFDAVRDETDARTLDAIRADALRLGCHDAASW